MPPRVIIILFKQDKSYQHWWFVQIAMQTRENEKIAGLAFKHQVNHYVRKSHIF